MAKDRHGEGHIDYRVADATNADAHDLGSQTFDGALCNLAVMDLSDTRPLMNAVASSLRPGGPLDVRHTASMLQQSIDCADGRASGSRRSDRDNVLRQGLALFDAVYPGWIGDAPPACPASILSPAAWRAFAGHVRRDSCTTRSKNALCLPRTLAEALRCPGAESSVRSRRCWWAEWVPERSPELRAKIHADSKSQ
jgi:hypothetical protein